MLYIFKRYQILYLFIQLFFLKNCAEDEEDTGAISLDNLGGVFIVLIAGIFLAVITLGFENCYYKTKDPFLVESVVVKTSGFVEHVKKDFWYVRIIDTQTQMVYFIKKILFDIIIK